MNKNEDLISRTALLTYLESLANPSNDIQFCIRLIKNATSVTLKKSCNTCQNSMLTRRLFCHKKRLFIDTPGITANYCKHHQEVQE